MLVQLPRLALDLLFPLHCWGCQRQGKLLCDNCIPQLPRLERPYCSLCGKPDSQTKCHWCVEAPLWVDGIRAPFLMEGPIKDGVYSLKYRGVRAAAAELGRLMAQYQAEEPVPGDVIVPVPLHRRRLRERGYNQSALLAREVSKLSGIPNDEGLLVRTKDTPPQVRAVSREQRRSNVEDSFRCPENVEGRALILVDDVATTGSTLSACASALKDRGAASVWGLVLAREGRA